MKKILWDIFGSAVCDMSTKEIAIAEKVIEHFILYDKGSDMGFCNVLNACRYAVEKEGKAWESVMLTKSRKRDILEIRNCIFHIFCSRVQTFQEAQAKMLGGVFDRTTIRHSIIMVEEWKDVDKNFRSKYARISQSVDEYLKQVHNEN